MVESNKQDYFCSLRPHNGHWIVEYNDPLISIKIYISSAASDNILLLNYKQEAKKAEQASILSALSAASQAKKQKFTPKHLHQIIGHAGAEAISKLLFIVDGIELTSLYT